MSSEISTSYSSRFKRKIEELNISLERGIYVIVGDTKILDFSDLKEHILDSETFKYVEDGVPFTDDWADDLLTKIYTTQSYSILSYAQYMYITSMVRPTFIRRVIFLEDNLRRLFPMDSFGYIEENDSIDKEYPLHQSGQYEFSGKYYYSVLSPDPSQCRVINLYEELKPESIKDAPAYAEFLDPYSENFTIDLFVNSCFEKGDFSKKIYVQLYRKQVVNAGITSKIMAINSALQEYGGSLFYVAGGSDKVEAFTPKNGTVALLKKYWGEHAEFRNLKLYSHPSENADIVEVSQAKVVETVINEYKKAKLGRQYKDVFLTAPTGAGKSLLFQLPAFYISEKGDVTIVISPLIALMKDQVNAIISRGFTKAAYINSEVSLIDRDNIIEQCQSGEIDVLYMAPELLMSYDITYFIGERKIGLIVIDEAHLITTWGRDFRVDYWYLGNHISKIRKYQDSPFPMIAVTATAVYGGDKNDMVFDTTDSLAMHNPHYFIGIVKRDNIEFLINNYDRPTKNFDTWKVNQTSDFIVQSNRLGFKTLVYAPYTKHVERIVANANKDENIAVSYHSGGMDSISKEDAEKAFRSNARRIMVCTKAFGMGVDIPDIQVVYHHAPSGLLPDYVQEIGRVARDHSIQGYAALNYSLSDQQYSKKLYGMSSIKLWQLKEVLRKLYDNYRLNGEKRNMLVSAEDFSFAFNDGVGDVATKVKTALMMLEKDYLAKKRFNVLIARPKQLFSKVFAKMPCQDWESFRELYPDMASEISRRRDNTVVVRLDLAKIWSGHFSQKGFPSLKRQFFTKSLFEPDGLDVTPVMRTQFKVENIQAGRDTIEGALNIVKAFFAVQGCGEFEKDDLVGFLKDNGYNDRKARELSSFVLNTFSGKELMKGVVDNNAFLQVKYSVPSKYRIFGSRYEASFASILTFYSRLFAGEEISVTRYVSKENALPHIRLGQLMEILEIGTFDVIGGEEPMIFVRLNSPETIKFDSRDNDYRNTILDKVTDKHVVSSRLFDHFFMRSFTNEERWNFIEDFFLGENCDELMLRYPGKDVERTDIIEILSRKEVQYGSVHTKEKAGVASTMEYPPRAGKYMPSDHLTIEVNGERITRTVDEWINEDAPFFYKVVKDRTIFVDRDTVYNRMILKLKRNHVDFWRKIKGLSLEINIPGYPDGTIASVPYTEKPVSFYKWWKKDRSQVYLTTEEKIKLFENVYHSNKKVLLEKDKKFLKV